MPHFSAQHADFGVTATARLSCAIFRRLDLLCGERASVIEICVVPIGEKLLSVVEVGIKSEFILMRVYFQLQISL